MIKGNGETVSIDCSPCSRGYERPTGFVEVYVYDAEPRWFTPVRVSYYSADCVWYADADDYIASSEHLFADRADAVRALADMNAAREREATHRTLAHLQSSRRTLSCNASYWTRQATKLEADLAAVRARIAVCKAAK